MNYNDIQNLSHNELNKLCKDIREEIIRTVSKNGGHLSSNLGVVELTVALLRVFNPIQDDILFDVGHQCYSYKLLTDRWKQFYTLRQNNGISGYPNIQESATDKFISGHSGTSLSLAFGFSYAKKLLHTPSHTISVVGDGSLTSGENFEAINNIGHYKLPVIIILNDNEMSISKNVGYLCQELGRLRNSVLYRLVNNRTKSQLCRMGTFGKQTLSFLERVKMATKKFFVPKSFFEEFGLDYFGPYNGHNIAVLEEIFGLIKKQNKPCIIHVVTKKGKGLSHIENNATQFHSSPPFVIENENVKIEKNARTFSHFFGETLLDIGKIDKKVIALTAAMGEGLKMSSFASQFPCRFIDMGIAEQTLITTAAGLARKGFKPVVGIYSTFLQRGYDQVIHDCCIQSEPVTFAIDRAGAVSSDGPTHQGSYDISFLLPVPNTVVMAPSNGTELQKMLTWTLENSNQPTFIRYPKDKTSSAPISPPIKLGKSWIQKKGNTGALLYLGPFEELCFEINQKLNETNKDFSVINARFAKPLDKELIDMLVSSYKLVVIIEDGIKTGGYASYVKDYIASIPTSSIRVISFGLIEEFISQKSRSDILQESGISANNIVHTIQNALR